jgi:peptidoglycan-associated lipoprotein
MHKNIFGALLILSFGLLLLSGCAKDQVKPDESIAVAKSAPVDSGADTAAAKKTEPLSQPVVQPQAEAQPLADSQQQSSAQQSAAQLTADAAVLPLKTINFEFDSYVLSQTARDILYNNADYLLKKYKGKVKLEGHCDERGSDEYNLALGENRAKAALNYLLTLGVPAEQLSIISYGKERPLDPASNEEAWAKNRRVEFTVNK